MKNLALVISFYELKDWSGGLSYYINLLNLIKNLKEINLSIYTDSAESLKSLKINNFAFKTIELKCLKKNNILFYFRKLIIFLFKKDYYLYFIFKKDKINILSHRKLFKNAKIKVIGWIPDLQHKVLSNFFNENTLHEREKYILDEIKNSDSIFVSSFQVKKEFKKYYNLYENIIPLRVMSFKNSKFIKDKSSLQNNYKFILFPSQFWKHKNHVFIIKAARLIKKHNLNIRFIFCGKVFDNRNKSYFSELKSEIKKYNLENLIEILGEVSKKELIDLQHNCIALINPSLYEGWSTINEEARVLNKTIFLSDIPGHKEQKNYNSIYFNQNQPAHFVKKLKNYLNNKKVLKNKLFIQKNINLITKINKESISFLKKVYQLEC